MDEQHFDQLERLTSTEQYPEAKPSQAEETAAQSATVAARVPVDAVAASSKRTNRNEFYY